MGGQLHRGLNYAIRYLCRNKQIIYRITPSFGRVARRLLFVSFLTRHAKPRTALHLTTIYSLVQNFKRICQQSYCSDACIGTSTPRTSLKCIGKFLLTTAMLTSNGYSGARLCPSLSATINSSRLLMARLRLCISPSAFLNNW